MRITTRLSYGVGQVSEGVKASAFSIFLFFYYNQVLGLSGTLAGFAAFLALAVDAVTDPMIGQVSDRFQSRWGRRHPFMLAGAIPFAFAMLLLFAPPAEMSEYQLFAWMLFWTISVRLLLTLFFVPHLSLGAELATGYHERTSLIGYRVFFAYAGQLVTIVVGFVLFFPPSSEYANGMLNAASYPGFGIFAGVLGMSAMLISAYGTRHTIPRLSAPAKNIVRENPLFAVINVFRLLNEKSFRILFLTTLLFMVMAGVTQTLLVYNGTYLFGFEPQHLGLLATSLVISIAFASSIAQFLSRRYDKKRTLAICVTVGSFIGFSPQILFLLGILEQMTLQNRLLYVYLANGMTNAFFFAYIIIVDSMLTDTIDEHELRTGRREEGLFFAARAFATKASYGLGALVAGIALDVIRFPTAAEPSAVSFESLRGLAIVAGPVSMFLFLLTIAISSAYPMTAALHKEIRNAIDARRATDSV